MKKQFLYILLILSTSLIAQEYSFEQINSTDGLSQNNVLAICQDDYGYTWFGTYDGLNRYDGIDFKIYRSNGKPNSLSSNLIRAVAADKNNNIWVSTFSDGISVLNHKTDEFIQFRNTPENPSVITSNNINYIFCDSRGYIWASSAEGGLNCFIPQADGTYNIMIFRLDDNNPNSIHDNWIFNISEDSKGRIWVSSYYALNLMILGDSGKVQNHFIHLAKDEKYYNIRGVIETDEGFLFGHFFGMSLMKIDENGKLISEILDYVSPQYFHMIKDYKGNIWTGGHNGIMKFEYRPGKKPLYVNSRVNVEGLENNILKGLFIRSLYIDKNEIVWCGTNGEGILKHNIKRSKFRHYKKTDSKGSISHNKIFSIYEDNSENVWLGTEGGGINILPNYDKKNYNNGFKSYDICPPGEQNFVHDIIEVKDNGTTKIWAGTGYFSILVELTKIGKGWNVEKVLEDKISHQVMVLFRDEYETIWIGTYEGGLYKYYLNLDNKYELINYLPSNSSFTTNVVRNIFEDSKGRLWIGTDKGLVLLTREQKKKKELEFTLFTNDPYDSNTISSSYTVPIIETKNGQIWIGTFGGGINLYNEGTTLTNGTFSNIDTKDGLPNNMIKSIIEDENNNLWVTTNQGLSKINTKTSKIRNYTTFDGLQDMQFMDLSGFRLKDGEILLGGVKGFNAFYPEEIKEDTIPPTIVFNDIEIMNKKISVGEKIDGKIILNKPINLTEEITLKHNQKNFQISFSAIHYAAPKGNSYKYMLEGFDEEWNTSSSDQRIARYTNIDPGTYTFKVIAANSDGYWTETPKTLTINIKPPFWLTTWFIICSILAIIIGTGAIIQFRFHLIKQQNIFLEKEVEKRNRETIEMNKKLIEQTRSLQDINAQLEERQQKIMEQAEELASQNEELDKHRNRLEQLVEERTIDLQRAKEKAEESDRLKSLFLANISHEIRTPMNAIVGFSSLLTEPELTKIEVEDFIKKINENSNSLLNIIDEIVTFSLIDSNQFIKRTIVFPLNEFLNSVLETYQSSYNYKEVKFVIKNNAEKENIMISSDISIINQILNQLVSNAFKFTNYGQIEIGACIAKHRVRIYIKDTGIGIPKEKLCSIFDSFVKLESNENGFFEGIGLGLSIAKKLAKLIDGNLYVKSKIGEGSEFTLSIPRS